MATLEANVVEIFSGIQGEGVFVGERQIFVRFAACNLSCQYCDTPAGREVPKECRIEQTPGKRDFKLVANPITKQQLLELVDKFNKQKGLHHSVNFTGGEPLLQARFLKNILPDIKKKGLLTYLETNGTLSDFLTEVYPNIDIIAMDMKLPSATGLSSYYKEHERFLKIAHQRGVFTKAVFVRGTTAKEVDEMAKLIAKVDKSIPLILQPVTPFGPIKHRPTTAEALTLQAVAKRSLEHVRVIPQTHKIIGQL